MGDCSQSKCYAPSTTCAMGELSYATCPHWKKRTNAPEATSASEEIRVPWTGDPFGLADVGFVSGTQRPVTVGIIGAHSAGKTTLLAAWYLLIAAGFAQLREYSFAGSYTLGGWEAVAGNLRWDPQEIPSFPEHTVSSNIRAPGLLHLIMSNSEKVRRSYLFTDAPGEWFNAWAMNQASPQAAGARWISTHADAFLLVADREALSGSNRGSARSSFQYLAKRLGAEQRGRPVALVWTKADVPVVADMENAIRQIVGSNLTDSREFAVSIKPNGRASTEAFADVLRWVLSSCVPPLAPPAEIGSTTDPLFLYGRR